MELPIDFLFLSFSAQQKSLTLPEKAAGDLSWRQHLAVVRGVGALDMQFLSGGLWYGVQSWQESSQDVKV